MVHQNPFSKAKPTVRERDLHKDHKRFIALRKPKFCRARAGAAMLDRGQAEMLENDECQ
jgi:hypothetical protein